MKDLNIKVVFAILYVITFLLIIFVPDEFVALALTEAVQLRGHFGSVYFGFGYGCFHYHVQAQKQ